MDRVLPSRWSILTASLVLWLVAVAMPLTAAPLPDGVHTPEELHEYIVGLSTRNFHDLVIEQCQLFHKRYPTHPLDESVWLLEIKANANSSRFAAAIRAVDSCLERFPNSKQVDTYRLFAGKCKRSLGDFQGALERIRPLVQSKQQDISESARYFLSECLLELGQTAEAETHLKYLAGLSPEAKRPERIRARLYFAMLMHKNGQGQEALKAYNDLMAIPGLPGDIRAQILLNLGQLAFITLNNPKQAAEYYGRYTAEYPDSPSFKIARRTLLRCYFRIEDYPRFLELCDGYFKQFPEERTKDLELCWLNAQVLLKSQKYTRAIPLLETITQSKELDANLRQTALRLYLGALYDTQQYNSVIHAAKLHLEKYPNAPEKAEVLYLCGKASEALKDEEGAIAYYQQSLPLAMGNAEVSAEVGTNLAQLLEKRKQWPEATRIWNELLNSVSKEKRPQLLLQIARCAMIQKDLTTAAAHLQTLLQNYPQAKTERHTAWLTLFSISLRQNKADQALQAANALIADPLTPPAENLKYQSIVGTILLSQKKYDEAAAQYARAVDFAVKNNLPHARILGTLTQLELSIGKDAAACTHGEALLSRPASDPLPVLQPEVMLGLSKAARKCQKHPLAEKALKAIIDRLDPKAKLTEAVSQCYIQLAFLRYDTQNFTEAKNILLALNRRRHASNLGDSADACALLAEVAWKTGDYSTALSQSERALEFSATAVWPETRPRALYIKARVLFDRDKAYDAAFRSATLCFIGDDCVPYTPRALKLAAEISTAKGEKKTADELLKELKTRFPEFRESMNP